MRFELRIALRYLLARRQELLISVISGISTLGVVVGVMILLISLAILTGMQGELRSRILGAASHLSIYNVNAATFGDYREISESLHNMEGIIGVSPVIYGKALISTSSGSGLATLKGILPKYEKDVTEFGRRIMAGSMDDLSSEPQQKTKESILPGIILGEELALTTGVFVGDTVRLISPDGDLSPFGMLPRVRNFKVVGIFRLGLYDFDSSWALLSLPDAQRMLGVDDEVMYVETRVADLWDVTEIGNRVRKQLGRNYSSMDWIEMNRSLFSAFWLEKMATTIFVSFIVAVAALNIFASQIMIVMEKTRDIAILRSMGTTAESVMIIFMLQGGIIGVVGTVIGAILGLSVCWVFDTYHLVSIPEDVYQVAFVPFKLLLSDFLLVVLLAPFACFVATIYPAWRASRLVITKALRYQ